MLKCGVFSLCSRCLCGNPYLYMLIRQLTWISLMWEDVAVQTFGLYCNMKQIWYIYTQCHWKILRMCLIQIIGKVLISHYTYRYQLSEQQVDSDNHHFLFSASFVPKNVPLKSLYDFRCIIVMFSIVNKAYTWRANRYFLKVSAVGCHYSIVIRQVWPMFWLSIKSTDNGEYWARSGR